MPVSQQIEQAFSAGTTVVTSTVRAARWLKGEYALQQRAAGRRAWPTPPIVDWETWLLELWQAATLEKADTPLLLTSLQERRMWMRMLKADAEQLVSAPGIAALAQSAYGLLSRYKAQDERKRTWGKSDAESFRRWAADFDAECARREWVPRAELEQRLPSLLAETELPQGLLLVGFERTTPAQTHLLESLHEKGVYIAWASSGDSAQPEYMRTAGQRQEIEACALWVRERLKERPEMRIGVLTPDLGAVQSEMERTFRRILMPQALGIFSMQPMPFEFSLGRPLAEVPVIQSALLLLRWLHEPLAEDELSCLLLSGFLLRDKSHFLELAKADARRRECRALSLEMSPRAFLRSVRKDELSAFEWLHNLLRSSEANRLDEDRLPSRWADLIQLFLHEAGWPGSAKRDTVHFQALRRWERALDEIALLDFDGLRMPYGEFLKVLAGHVQEVVFAPESEGAPVQIMGAVEAAGQQFDALWFLSADDQCWPPRGRPHPLLPGDVQRRYKMPFADLADDLELAKAVTARIAASAPVVVFSYAERNKDGELRPSPLLPVIAPWCAPDVPPAGATMLSLDCVEENAEVAPWPHATAAGGTEVLKKQAACPFQAFASKRLGAEPLNRSEWGLSEAERGQLLHDVLCRIWSPDTGVLHTSDDLQAAIQERRLDAILVRAIAESFRKFDDTEGWERAYIESEKRRLQFRLRTSLETEAARAPFKVIACEEKLEDISVGDLKLNLRVDRVDELPDGSRILIDYKSGDVTTKDWETPRLKEPQLPLYAAFGGVEDLRGILFAKIRAGSDKPILGCIANEDVLVIADENENKKLAKKPFNAERRDDWNAELRRLAGGFLQGEANIDPKEGKDTCQYCGLQRLCRITELIELEDPETESEESDA